MKNNEYQCAACQGIFTKGWSDEEAEKEYQHFFPNNRDDRVLVCDDCYNKMHPKDFPELVEKANRLYGNPNRQKN